MAKKKRLKPKAKSELSDEAFEKLSQEEQHAYIQNQLDSDPQGAFLSLAIGAFEDKNLEDFDYLAGMAVQYSDYSILTELAMTLMKTMQILEAKDPECTKIYDKNADLNAGDIVSNNYYIRLSLMTKLILKLIEEERLGNISLDNDFEDPDRELLFGLIDLAVRRSEK